MNLFRGLAATLLAATCVISAEAQPILVPPGAGFAFGIQGRRARFSASFGSYSYGYAFGPSYYDPFFYDGPYYRRVTVVYPPPTQVIVQPIVVYNSIRQPEEPEKIVFVP